MSHLQMDSARIMTEKPTGFSKENHLAQQCHTSKECCSHFVKEHGLTSAMVENAHSMLTGD
jgi:putative lipase involved disintegration of autophagic bodies